MKCLARIESNYKKLYKKGISNIDIEKIMD